MADRVIPRFENEAEEARWWFEHRDDIGRDLVSASQQGRTGEGSVARRARKAKEVGRSASGVSSRKLTHAK